MVAAQLFGHVRMFELFADRRDRGDRDLLDEDMRRHQDQTGDLPARQAGMQQGDRRAVAMADQDRFLQPQGLQQAGQGDRAFVMHVSGVERFLQNIRLPVSIA